MIRVTNTIEEDVKNEVRVIDSLLQQGDHRNIIGILKHGWLETAGKVYFIDMELADLTLSEYIDYIFHNKDLQFPIPDGDVFNPVFSARDCTELERLRTVFEIGHQVACGLEFLHENAHVHRDLKPQNGNSIPILAPDFSSLLPP